MSVRAIEMMTPEHLQTIASVIDAQTLNESLVMTLRSEYPGLHFTYCMDDDVGNYVPAFEGAGFNLYLVDGREHCLSLTRQYEHASGIVIAEVVTD